MRAHFFFFFDDRNIKKEVMEQIEKLNCNKLLRPDGIHLRVVEELKSDIAKRLIKIQKAALSVATDGHRARPDAGRASRVATATVDGRAFASLRRGFPTPTEPKGTPLSLCDKSLGGDDKRLHGNHTKLFVLGEKNKRNSSPATSEVPVGKGLSVFVFAGAGGSRRTEEVI